MLNLSRWVTHVPYIQMGLLVQLSGARQVVWNHFLFCDPSTAMVDANLE